MHRWLVLLGLQKLPAMFKLKQPDPLRGMTELFGKRPGDEIVAACRNLGRAFLPATTFLPGYYFDLRQVDV